MTPDEEWKELSSQHQALQTELAESVDDDACEDIASSKRDLDTIIDDLEMNETMMKGLQVEMGFNAGFINGNPIMKLDNPAEYRPDTEWARIIERAESSPSKNDEEFCAISIDDFTCTNLIIDENSFANRNEGSAYGTFLNHIKQCICVLRTSEDYSRVWDKTHQLANIRGEDHDGSGPYHQIFKVLACRDERGEEMFAISVVLPENYTVIMGMNQLSGVRSDTEERDEGTL